MKRTRYCRRDARCDRPHLMGADGRTAFWPGTAKPGNHLPNAVELMQLHFSTLVTDPERWHSLIADEIVWELPYAASLGQASTIVGRTRVIEHTTRFIGAFSRLRLFEIEIVRGADPDHAVACALARGQVHSTERLYEQECVIFLKSSEGKIHYLREYFDPLRAAWAFAVDEAHN